MEAPGESLENGEAEAGVCGECGVELPDEEPPVRIESVGKNSIGLELVNVTFETTRGRVDIWRGIIGHSGEFLSLQDFLHKALEKQIKRYIEFVTKTDRIWGLLARAGKGLDPEEDGVEFAS